jgi:hypothetical protein
VTATAARAAAAPQQPLPHAPAQRAAPGEPRRRQLQPVRVPWRLVASAHYPDASLAVYLKVAALADRPEGCTASVAVLADYLGMSKSTVERGLRPLTQPDPDTGIPETTSRRRTLPGGTGHTALRTVRTLTTSTELFVWLPVGAADALTPRQLRAYAVISYCTARRIPFTMAELAGYLRHQSGPRAGQPVDERTARAIADALEDLGWITIHRRQGPQGRHAFTVHKSPLHPVPGDLPTGVPEIDDGSGPEIDGGSLASKDDHGTGRPDDEEPPAVLPSAVGEVQVRKAAPPVDNSPTGDGGRRLAYGGPQLTLAPRIHAVLEPVRPQYATASPWEQRRIAREVGRQLDAGTDPDQLRLRLQARRAATDTASITAPGRWILGAALPRWGCGLIDCESGQLWSTGRPCAICQELRAARRTTPPAAPRQAPVWHECAGCGAPSPVPLPGGLCRPCTPNPERSPAVQLPPSLRTPCPDCCEPVIRTLTAAGRWLAVDPAPHPDGNTAVYRTGTDTVRSRRPTPEDPQLPWEDMHMPHVATCAAPTPVRRPMPTGATVLADRRRAREGGPR